VLKRQQLFYFALGALGKRTRFQTKELAQLTVKVSVAETNRINNLPTVQAEHLPQVPYSLKKLTSMMGFLS